MGWSRGRSPRAAAGPARATGPATYHAVPDVGAREGPPITDVQGEKGREAPQATQPGTSGPAAAGATGLRAELDGCRKALARARRETEELRLHLIREAEQRDELLSVVSHELRTPITVIDGFNRLLLSRRPGPLTSLQEHCLEQSRRSCQRLNVFVGNLLEKERLRSGVAALCLGRHSVEALLRGVAAFLDPLVAESGQQLVIACAPEANPARFDPLALEQVLVNLIGNALKYGPRGGTIRVETQRLGDPPRVEIAVQDEGPGIPEEDRERIFEPYVRRAEHRGAGGLGLGLAICRRIIEAHGGSLGVGQGPKGGSRFAFTLPAEPAGERAE